MSDLNYFSGRVDFVSHSRFPESPDHLIKESSSCLVHVVLNEGFRWEIMRPMTKGLLS